MELVVKIILLHFTTTETETRPGLSDLLAKRRGECRNQHVYVKVWLRTAN